MARPPSADSIIRNTKKQQVEKKTPIATDMFIPNLSGIARHPEAQKTFVEVTGDTMTGTLYLEGRTDGLGLDVLRSAIIGAHLEVCDNLTVGGDIIHGGVTDPWVEKAGDIMTGNLTLPRIITPSILATDGILTLGAVGDEDITFDFLTDANRVTIGSNTGVSFWDFGDININSDRFGISGVTDFPSLSKGGDTRVNLGFPSNRGTGFEVYHRDDPSRPGQFKIIYGGYADTGKVIYTNYNGTSFVDNFVIDSSGNVGIGVIDPHSKLEVAGAVSSATATITASSDNYDVSGINTLFVDLTADGELGGLTGGVNGQVLHIIILDPTWHIVLEHATGLGDQDLINHLSADETMSHGGAIYVCNGSDWYDTSHARHV